MSLSHILKTFVSKLAYQVKYLKWKYAFSSELHIQQVPVESQSNLSVFILFLDVHLIVI